MRKPIPTLVCMNTLDLRGFLGRESAQPVADEETHPYPCLYEYSWPAWVFRKGKQTASSRWGDPSLYYNHHAWAYEGKQATTDLNPLVDEQRATNGCWGPPPPLPPTTIDLHGLTNRQQATNGCWGPPLSHPQLLTCMALQTGNRQPMAAEDPPPSHPQLLTCMALQTDNRKPMAAEDPCPPPPPPHTHKSCPAWPYKRATGNQWQVRISPSSTPHPCTETSDLHDPATTNMANQGWLRSSLSSPTPPPVS